MHITPWLPSLFAWWQKAKLLFHTRKRCKSPQMSTWQDVTSLNLTFSTRMHQTDSAFPHCKHIVHASEIHPLPSFSTMLLGPFSPEEKLMPDLSIIESSWFVLFLLLLDFCSTDQWNMASSFCKSLIGKQLLLLSLFVKKEAVFLLQFEL